MNKQWEYVKGSIAIDSDYARSNAEWLLDVMTKKQKSAILKQTEILKSGFDSEVICWFIADAIIPDRLKALIKKQEKSGGTVGGITRDFHRYAIAATLCNMISNGDLSI